MRVPILIGIALAVVIVALIVVAPFMRSAASIQAARAQEQAALAERELARYSVTMPLLVALADLEQLREADLGAAVNAAGDRLREAGNEYAQAVRDAQRLAEEQGLPAPELPRFSPDEAGVRAAISAFQRHVDENADLLQQALRDAKEAINTDRQALGVPQALGMAEYVRAAGLANDARQLRTQQADAESRLLEVGSQWKVAQGYLDHFRGLDVAPMLVELREDLRELADLRTQANERVVELAAEVSERETELAAVEDDLSGVQQQFLSLQSRGFLPNPAPAERSFQEYREDFRSLSQRLYELQQRALELRHGGRPGAELTGDDPLGGELVGGDRIVGLEELRRRLAVAEERAQRLDRANVSLEEHIKYVIESGQRAQSDATTYQNRLAELAARQKTIAAEIVELATAAFNREAEAIDAAEAAVRAFTQSRQAADAWMNAARQVQRDKDPNRRNERLMLVTRDPYLEQVPRAAEAAARVLEGRIHAQRVASLQRLIDNMQRYEATRPDFEFDADIFQGHLSTAQKAAIDTLLEARALYDTIASKWSSEPTVWVPQAGLAGVYHLLSIVDPAQAEMHLQEARRLVNEAVNKAQAFPYARPFVQYREQLMAGAQPAPEAEPEPGTEPTPEEDDGGFFLEDEPAPEGETQGESFFGDDEEKQQ